MLFQKIVLLLQLLVILQSDWEFAAVDWSLDNAARVNVSSNCNSQSGTLILGNKPIKVIDNASSFFVSWSEINIFFGVEYYGKNKSNVVQHCLYSY